MRQVIFLLVGAVALTCVSGCSICKPGVAVGYSPDFAATSPGIDEIIAGVPADVAAIVLIRSEQFYKCGGPMYIQINGEEIGPLATQTYLITYVPPGEYEFTSQEPSIWDRSKSVAGRVRLEANPGRAYFINGRFEEGSVNLRQLSVEDARAHLKETVRIISPAEKRAR
jgi:hypothetical protein